MWLKWIFDRVVSFIALCLIWWVLVIVAVMVKVKMPGGPAFFCQKRVGKDGRPFTCHKFRTMVVSHGGSLVSVAGDARITPFGAKLRRSKIDELPELWDVLVGNMSFVGPRPDVPEYAERLVGEERAILSLRPGITGPATLKYRHEEELLASVENPVDYYDTVVFPDKIRLNLFYLRHYSFVTDIKIILATVSGKKMEYAGEVI